MANSSIILKSPWILHEIMFIEICPWMEHGDLSLLTLVYQNKGKGRDEKRDYGDVHENYQAGKGPSLVFIPGLGPSGP
jgi:hypothetical protein